MGKIILVTGGARSGKSTFAEEMASKYGDSILYVATSIPFDEEMKERIRKHRAQRPLNWETAEAYKDIDKAINSRIEGKNAVMLDCITVMVTNIMFEIDNNWDDELKQETVDKMETNVKSEIAKLLTIAHDAGIPFILVTNEVGMGIVPDNPISRAFRDIAGRVNQIIAREADEVYLCVSGIPVRIK